MNIIYKSYIFPRSYTYDLRLPIDITYKVHGKSFKDQIINHENIIDGLYPEYLINTLNKIIYLKVISSGKEIARKVFSLYNIFY